MKNLRYRSSFLLVPALALSLVLSSCGAVTGILSADTGSASQSTASSYTESSSGVSAVSSAESAVTVSEAFSERDLSGSYEESEAVTILLTGSSAEASSDAVEISGGTVTITAEGTYILSGSLTNGSVIVSAGEEAKVQLVLNGVTIRSDTFAAIYVEEADKVFVTLAEGSVNTLSNGGSFVLVDDSNVDGAIFSRDDLTLNGSGTLVISSPAGHGIVGKDEVTVTGGTYEITAAKHAVQAKDSIAVSGGSFTLKAGEDGLHAENDEDDTLGNILIAGGSFVITSGDDAVHATALLAIEDGSMSITAAEGLEATYIRIDGGDIVIAASDDGVNAAQKSSAFTPTFEMNGGSLKITMGSGDTDGIDSNGDIVINGGTIDVTGNSAFDYDGTAELNGGTVIVNGQQVTTLPNQMMGGGMGGPGGDMGGPGSGGGRHR